MSIYAEDEDGYRLAWAGGGYSKEDYMKCKAHWAAMPKFVLPPPTVYTKYKCHTCGKITELPEDRPPPSWFQ